jgi:4-hydroxy-tetrahydrodipicolinate synthase
MLFAGIIPAVLTPFDDDDCVDVDALRRNVAFLLDHGVHGLVATGTMGEAGQLGDDERRAVVEACVAEAAGRVPVVVGVSSAATAAATAHAAAAREAGAQGVMCLPPLLYAGEERELVAWFAAVGEAAGLPVMAYNNPHASGIDLLPDAIARIAGAVPAVRAIKECSGDPRRMTALLGATDLEVLVGADDCALEGFAAGATGWVSGVANVAPEPCCALLEQVEAGRLPEARETYQRLLPLARLDMTPQLVQYFKGGLDAAGLHGGPVRPPRTALSEDQQAVLRDALAALGGPVVA